jgi:anaerobic selenocysteine-containing dehydrogenase
MDAVGDEVLGDVRELADAHVNYLRKLGRIPKPLVRYRDENGLTAISWEEALDTIGERIKKADPRQTGWYVGAQSVSNEGAFAVKQVSRGLGCPNLDSSARFGYIHGVAGLGELFGVPAPTSSLKDLLGSDLIVLWGTDPSETHPLILKYLHIAKDQGSRIAVIDPRKEERLVKYWVPSILESSVFGTRLMDDYYPVRRGGDIAFIQGVLKTLAERNGFDHEFINAHATGVDDLTRPLRQLAWGDLAKGSGVSQAEMEKFAGIYSAAKSAMFLYGTGITRQRHSLSAVRSIATLAAVRGMVGKKRCGLLPLGQSNDQGAVDLGVVPGEGGFTVTQMIKAAAEGKLQVFCTMSGNLFEAPIDRNVVIRALERIDLRVHIGTVFDPSMFHPPGDVVIILPSMTRYEIPGGCTTTSVERRVRFSPEIPGSSVREAKPDWQIPALIAAQVDLANQERFPWKDAAQVRADLEKSVPRYRGVAGLREEGKFIQWGGERLYEKSVFDSIPGGKCRLRLEDLPPVTE